LCDAQEDAKSRRQLRSIQRDADSGGKAERGALLGRILDQGNPADDEVLRPLARFGIEQFDGEGSIVRAQDEPAVTEFDIRNDETRAAADSVGRLPAGAVLDERVVMPVDDDQSFGEDDGLHGQSVGSGDADGDESLPCDTVTGGVRADVLKGSRRQRHHLGNRRRVNDRLEESGAVGDDGDGRALEIGQLDALMRMGQEVLCLEFLGGEDAVDGLRRKAALSMQEVRDMGLGEVGLAREERNAE
jgi:hypothetical protein